MDTAELGTELEAERAAARVALARAEESLEFALARVRSARSAQWSSELAERYRVELDEAARELRSLIWSIGCEREAI
jgi:superfamily I DNA/RNA helicase